MKNLLSSIVWLRKLMVIAGSGLLLVSCGTKQLPMIEVTGTTMGTTYSVKVVSGTADQQQLKQQIDQLLVALNQVFSTYIPDSELSIINQGAGELPVSAALMRVLRLSEEIHVRSGGAFDVTVGPLVNLWGFGPQGPRNGVPSQEEIDRARSLVGFGLVRLSETGLNKPPGLAIDLSAIAKGYAVDVVSELLETQGETRYLVEIGGEVRASGSNARDVPWVIGVEAPEMHSRRLLRTMPLRNLGMATSGDYRNYFEFEGRVYSHTIDPATGWPVSHRLASVTVFHPSAGYADALATAFSVMGPDRTMAFAEENKLPVLAILRDQGTYREMRSTELNRYLAEITHSEMELEK